MTGEILSYYFSKSNRAVYSYFILSILLGFSVGFYFSENTGNSSMLMMRVALCCNASISSLLCSVFLPFLLSFLFIYFSKQWLLYCVCFWRFFSFGYFTNCLLCAFGSASWLIQSLSFFPDLLALILLTWFCIRNLACCRHSAFRDFLVTVSMLFPICVADYFYFPPL